MIRRHKKLAAYFLALTVFTVIQRKRFSFAFADKIDRPFVREVSKYAVPLIPVTLIAWMSTNVSSVMIFNMLDVASVGVFTAALSMAATVNVIQAGFNTYWAPYVFENYQKGETARFFTVHRLMACLLTGFGLLTADTDLWRTQRPVVQPAFGADLAPAVEKATLSAAASLTVTMSSPAALAMITV